MARLRMDPSTRLLLGGFLTLAVAMGVGRFFYTPLLPLMEREFGFGPPVAGLIASANFAGYLLGSMGASLVPSGRVRLLAFRWGLVLSVATTLSMGFADNLPLWLILRGLGGVASAVAMIFAAGITAEALGRIGQEGRVGWLFGGVGFGIAASALLVRFCAGQLGAGGLWFAAGAISAALLPIILREVGERDLPTPFMRQERQRRIPTPLPFWPLMASYTIEGLGYSIFATFIVAIVKLRPGMETLGDWVWVTVGLAILPSTVLWGMAAERIGFANALLAAFLAQIVGVLLPALSGAGWAALLGAVLFGGTFTGISVLTLPLGRHGLSGRGFAVLTAGFGLGQMTGPLLAGLFVTSPAHYAVALLASGAVLVLGALCLLGAILRRDRPGGSVARLEELG